jgi:catechol-2,3-dioxygenase
MAGKHDGKPMRLAHVAIRVRDIDRAVDFYTEVVGLDLKHKGMDMAFLGISPETSHELALFALSPDAEGPDQMRVGMYHFAWQMNSFEALEALHERILASGARIGGYSPDPRSANVMFFDPDGNEIEAIWEPTEEQRRAAEESGQGIPKLAQATA